MEGHCSTGQSVQWAVVPMEEEERGGGGGGGEEEGYDKILVNVAAYVILQ